MQDLLSEMRSALRPPAAALHRFYGARKFRQAQPLNALEVLKSSRAHIHSAALQLHSPKCLCASELIMGGEIAVTPAFVSSALRIGVPASTSLKM
eukprot:935875-Amphidinium_carterae.1